MSSSNARHSGIAIISTLVLAATAPQLAGAADMTKAPHYAHALHELQFSRFALSTPADANVSGDQKRAVSSVDQAIAELKSAGIVDTMDLAANERSVSARTQQERLTVALNAIYAAKFDVTHYSELNAPREGWRSRVTSDLLTAETAARAAAAMPQAAAASAPPAAAAPPPQTVAGDPRKHGSKGAFRPAYRYAIRDLDYAEKLLAAPEVASDPDVQTAVGDIRSAAGSFKQAAVEDNNLNGKVNVDANMAHMDRLHSVLALLHQVHTDVARRETNEAASDLESTAISHVDSATEHVKLAIARQRAKR